MMAVSLLLWHPALLANARACAPCGITLAGSLIGDITGTPVDAAEEAVLEALRLFDARDVEQRPQPD